jgi:hypothetical protein
VRNIGTEEHALSFLSDDVVHEVNAPATDVAREIGGDPREKVTLKRFLLLGT